METMAKAEVHDKDHGDDNESQSSNKSQATQHSGQAKESKAQSSAPQGRLTSQTSQEERIGNSSDQQTTRRTSPRMKNKNVRNRHGAKFDSSNDVATGNGFGEGGLEKGRDESVEEEGSKGVGVVGEGEVNPLSVDLYDKLCAEKKAEEMVQWDGCMARENLQKACKTLFLSEKHLHALLMSIFMAVTFAMVFGLCVLQAQLSMTSKELLAKVQGPKKAIPQGVYSLYYDYLDSGVLPENADLRANTSIFVH